ncbi:hypothetical protein RN22_03700 [Grimontia sp. AD028]|uniref:hypothetical protein n=1 Tax=Grimontia sp. AD028 TaxID=1581149 RepID=UPI00061B3E25|nr:hypothetical protein [Grimontia sp. AD028]KKD61733.1 hypothetical protein RN22_03700 [Grimontia sp. AD028]
MMSQGLSQFLRRNVSGEQSLKPVVRSYYSHVSDDSSPTSPQSSSDTVTDWLVPEPTKTNLKPTQSEQSEFSSAVQPEKAAHSDRNIEYGFNREVDSSSFPVSPESVRSHSTQKDYSSDIEAEFPGHNAESSSPEWQRQVWQRDAENKSTVSARSDAPSNDVSPHSASAMTLAELRDLELESSSVAPENRQQPAKRRDFTKQVAASILGDEKVSPNTERLASVTPVESALSPEKEGSPQDHLEVSVTIGHVSIVPAPKAPEKKAPSWKPPVSLTDYLRDRQEGKR